MSGRISGFNQQSNLTGISGMSSAAESSRTQASSGNTSTQAPGGPAKKAILILYKKPQSTSTKQASTTLVDVNLLNDSFKFGILTSGRKHETLDKMNQQMKTAHTAISKLPSTTSLELQNRIFAARQKCQNAYSNYVAAKNSEKPSVIMSFLEKLFEEKYSDNETRAGRKEKAKKAFDDSLTELNDLINASKPKLTRQPHGLTPS